MIPESNIIAEIDGLWIEKFPEGDSTAYPKGLVKRISCVPTQEKSRTCEQYTSRISIFWYADNTITFDDVMRSYKTKMRSLESSPAIKNVNFANRSDGYDDRTDKHIMELEFIIKHNIV